MKSIKSENQYSVDQKRPQTPERNSIKTPNPNLHRKTQAYAESTPQEFTPKVGTFVFTATDDKDDKIIQNP